MDLFEDLLKKDIMFQFKMEKRKITMKLEMRLLKTQDA